MINISMVQALHIWSELMDAYHGKNGYGGDTAEIYTYRLMSDVSPAAWELQLQSSKDADVDRACASLHAIVEHFVGIYGCRVEVDGKRFGPWVKKMRQGHRFHVRVVRKPRKP